MNSVELRNQRAQAIAEARKLIDSIEAEGREMTVDEKNTADKMFADADALASKAEAAERKEKLETAEAELRQAQPRKTSPRLSSRNELDRNGAAELMRSWALAGAPGHRPSADDNLRAAEYGFDLGSQVIQYRALSKGSNSAGGYTVPTSFSTELEKILNYYWNVFDAVESFNTSDGTDYPWPTVDDSTNASSIVTEASGIGSSTDPSFGAVTFKSFDYYSPIVKCSNQLLRDSARDIPSLLAELFAERMARALDTAIVSTNAGSSAPEGMLYGVSAGANLASGNAMTVAKLLATEVSVPIQYRNLPGVGWLMHDATWSEIRGLAETTGRLMIGSDLQNGVEKRLLGYPVHISNNMTSFASPGDNQPLILFGALKKYKIRRVGGSTLTRLNELYAANGQVGFVLHEAFDGRWLTKSGVKTLNSYDAP